MHQNHSDASRFAAGRTSRTRASDINVKPRRKSTRLSAAISFTTRQRQGRIQMGRTACHPSDQARQAWKRRCKSFRRLDKLAIGLSRADLLVTHPCQFGFALRRLTVLVYPLLRAEMPRNRANDERAVPRGTTRSCPNKADYLISILAPAFSS